MPNKVTVSDAALRQAAEEGVPDARGFGLC